VDIVSDACAIGGGVVVTENGQFFSLANDDFLDEGEQVVGVFEGLISQQVRFMCSACVEVT
jgi:hypothetical protein